MIKLVALWLRQQVLRGALLLFQGPVTFEEVPTYFTEGQWDLLDPHHRILYRDVIGKDFLLFGYWKFLI